MKNYILLIGRSASGKDFLASELCSQYDLKQVISYTTRAPRYEGENTHLFISKEDAHKLYPLESRCATTTINGEEYFTTFEQIMECDVYIIDYKGALDLIKSFEDKNVECNFVILDCRAANDDLRFAKATARCNTSKGVEITRSRFANEDMAFKQWESIADYSCCNYISVEGEAVKAGRLGKNTTIYQLPLNDYQKDNAFVRAGKAITCAYLGIEPNEIGGNL